VPKASKETRAATVKQLAKLEEAAKQRVRKVRQAGIDRARKFGKEDGVSQDDAHTLELDIDNMSKQFLEQIASLAKIRKAELAGE
jgi:ribosome recycling factor